jgi:hypothetical protein
MATESTTSQRADRLVHRRLAVAAGSLAVALALLDAAGASAAGAPPLHARVSDGTLLVRGTPFADTVALRVSAADADQLEIDAGNDGTADATVDLRTFTSIAIATGAGDDVVKLDTANGAFTTSKPTVVLGGRGNDTLIGGSGNETFFGESGNDVVDGNGGADTAFLGAGDDTFTWDPGDGSDTVDGGSGFDTHVFNGAGGSEVFAATANGSRVRFTRSTGNIVMDLDGIESLEVNALGGADQVTVNDLTGTGMTEVNVDLAGSLKGTTADGAVDTVNVLGTTGNDSILASASGGTVAVNGLAATVRIAHADPALDTLTIDPLGGSNIVLVEGAVNGLIGVSVQ